MARSLVIVESPAKAKTINKYLGKDFIVKSSIGHIRDLPTSGSNTPSDPKARAKQAALTRKMSPEDKLVYKKEQGYKSLVARMGIDPAHGWKPNYQILPGKEKVVKELQERAKTAETIYLATDMDREGEAIASHLQQVLGGDDSRFKRVTFNEITKKAIQEAFSKPEEVDLNRVNAQQARRFLDRVVGFMVSPLLWKKVARGLSAGRVQSVALRLVVEREREIRAFVPEEYWDIFSHLTTKQKDAIKFQLTKYQNSPFKAVNEKEAHIALNALNAADFKLSKREDRPTSSKPTAPFITSSLQQAASTRLGFGVKRTMMAAQKLYEAGYITYMRTDSTNLSEDALNACREYIAENFGSKYLSDKPNIYSSKEGAQEAHEAIRPSDVNTLPTKLKEVEKDAEKLYELIWKQFVACQMSPAQYLSTNLKVAAGDYELSAKGRVLKFDGYTKVQTPAKRNEDEITLPDIQVGEYLNLKENEANQHFTKPIARFTEASLVKELEKRGIGRPSTYANIISTIQDRGYVGLVNKRFYAEKIGEIVTDRLSENFDNFMEYNFTADMEQTLDLVASGKKNWLEVLDHFYDDLQLRLDKSEADIEQGGMRPNKTVETDIDCPCGKMKMAIRTAGTGVFLSCTGYSLPAAEQCKKTINLTPGDEAVALGDSEDAEMLNLKAKHRCAICGTAMESYLIDAERKLHICGNNPDCEGYEVEKGKFAIKGYEGPSLECDKCGAKMQLKSGRFGKYFGCTNDACKNTRKLLKNGQAAPPKSDPIVMDWLACQKVDDHYVLRDGAAGIFLAASKFPKNRETRPPTVKELLSVKDQLDPKFNYLTEAPVQDPNGRDAVVRFSRKNKSQYVMSEDEKGKATGWVALYDGDRWIADASKLSSKPKSTKK